MFSQSHNQPLEAYLDRELSAEQRSEVERHLAVCAACSEELETLRRLSQAFALYQPEVPAGLAGRIHEAVAQGWDIGILRIARVISAVAASIVLGGVFYLTFAQTQQHASASTTPLATWEAAATGQFVSADAPASTADAQLADYIYSDLSHGTSTR